MSNTFESDILVPEENSSAIRGTIGNNSGKKRTSNNESKEKTTLTLQDRVDLSLSSDSPITFVDYDRIVPASDEEMNSVICNLFNKENDVFGYFENGRFSDTLIQKFQEHIFPSALSFTEDFLGFDSKEILSDSHKMATYRKSFPGFKNVSSAEECAQFMDSQEKIIGFLNALLSSKDEAPKKEGKVKITQRSILFFALWAMMNLYSMYKEIEGAYAEYKEKVEEEFCDALEKKHPGISSKLIFMFRMKSDWSIISKLLRKGTITAKDIMADLFGTRIIVCVDDPKEAEELINLVLYEFYDHFVGKNIQTIDLENRGGLSEQLLQDLQKKCEDSAKEHQKAAGQPSLFSLNVLNKKKNFTTIKFEGDWHADDGTAFPWELQVEKAGAQNESHFNAHIFYDVFRTEGFLVRRFITTKMERFTTKIKKGLVAQYYKHQKNINTNLTQEKKAQNASLKNEILYQMYGQIDFSQFEENSKIMSQGLPGLSLGMIHFDEKRKGIYMKYTVKSGEKGVPQTCETKLRCEHDKHDEHDGRQDTIDQKNFHTATQALHPKVLIDNLTIQGIQRSIHEGTFIPALKFVEEKIKDKKNDTVSIQVVPHLTFISPRHAVNHTTASIHQDLYKKLAVCLLQKDKEKLEMLALKDESAKKILETLNCNTAGFYIPIDKYVSLYQLLQKYKKL